MKKIPLTQGKFALVDDADFDWLNQWKWRVDSEGYAVSSRRVLMHRLILNTPDGMDTDHRDTDRLNNQRENLRIATKSENFMNQRKRFGTSSKHKGVCWHKNLNKWLASIKACGRRIHLGYFESEDDAGLAYNVAALKYFGEFARLNQIGNENAYQKAA